MSNVRVALLLCVVWMVVPASPSLGQYEVLVDFDDIRVGPQYDLLAAHMVDGSTVYAVVRGIESSITPEWESQITKVENIDGTPVTTELVSNAAWKAFTGGDQWATILPGNRMAIIGDYLQFLDSSADGIYRAHKDSGALSLYVSTNAVATVTGEEDADFVDPVAISTNGEMAFYDQVSDHILLVADSNGLPHVSIFVDAADIDTLYVGGVPVNNVSGGMTFDCRGNLYWTLSQTGGVPSAGSIYKRDAVDGSLSQVIEEIDIQLTTLEFGNVAFNDLFAAPDGNIYFYERTSDNIMYFDPNDPVDPAATLAIYLTPEQLIAGPAGEFNVTSFNARGDRLTWDHIGRGAPDIYHNPLADRAGDLDGDGDVDLVDYASFADCLAGSGAAPNPTAPGVSDADCLHAFDIPCDCDGDVDLKDFALFQTVFNR